MICFPWLAGKGMSLGGNKGRKLLLGDMVDSVNRLTGWVIKIIECYVS